MGRYYGKHRECIARKVFPYVFIVIFILILYMYVKQNKEIPNRTTNGYEQCEDRLRTN